MSVFALSILTQIEFNHMAGWPMRKSPMWMRPTKGKELAVLLMFQKYKCYYCGEEIRHGACDDPMRASIDHVVPLVAGGEKDISNKVAACQQCNTDKGCFSLNKFLRTLQ